MDKLMKEFEAFFKEKGFLDISDDEDFYDVEGSFYEFNKECSVVMQTSTFFDSSYHDDVVKVDPILKKAENIDDAWDKIKDRVKMDLEYWVEDFSREEDFWEDERFVRFIDRVLSK